MSETVSKELDCLLRSCTIPDHDDIDGILVSDFLEFLCGFTSTIEIDLVEVDWVPECIEDGELAPRTESWIYSEYTFSVFWLGHEEIH